MQQFIPFEDEWDMLDRLAPSQLIPYRIGLPCSRGAAAQRTAPTSPSMLSTSPVCAPIVRAVPAANSKT